MQWLRNLLTGLGLIQSKPTRRRILEDDMLDAIIDYIDVRNERSHIVAVRNMKTAELLKAQFAHRGPDHIRCFYYQRIATGIVFRDERVSLSCTFTIMNEMVYRQLTSRLKGEDIEYSVHLDPRVKLHDYDRAKRRG